MPRSARHGAALRVLLLTVTLLLAGCAGTAPADSGDSAERQTVVRVPGDAATITDAVQLVEPGGLVLVSEGNYPESVTIDVEGVTLRGTDRNTVQIDGGGQRPFGVVVTADGVRVENLTVHSALLYGVLVTSMHDESGPIARGAAGYEEFDAEEFPPLQRFAVDHVTAYNNGLYGIYAFNAQHGVITDSYASGSADSGIYVGQCTECGILISGNVAERNAIGFENANASAPLVVAGNRFSANRVGMTLISNYQEAFSPQQGNVVAGNLIANNSSADSPAHARGAFGTGLGIDGGQQNRIVANRIEGNPVTGVRFGNTEDLAATGNELVGNVFAGNGLDLADTSAPRTPSSDNCIEGEVAELTALPPQLLEASCPAGGPVEGVSAEELPQVEVPSGISFLEVPPPQSQPSLDIDETVPDPLPDTVAMPEVSTLEVPASDYLRERTGTS